MGSTASGGRYNCHVAGKHMHIANLILNNFTKIVNPLCQFSGWTSIQHDWIQYNLKYVLYVYRKRWEVHVERQLAED